MRFSDLTVDFSGSTNRLYERVQELRSKKADVIDLVHGSVHDAGIFFPEDVLNDILRESAKLARAYRPDAMGQKSARTSIARYVDNDPERLLLTPGTSVSYWYAFRLLAEPGDQILCPTPSYPLFDYIARMSGVELATYRLDEDRSWQIDLDHLESQIGDRTRAIVVISPHNPTGMVANRSQQASLGELARRHDVPIISDDVFREFIFDGNEAHGSANTNAPLVFSLNGFSKMFALPGMKLGWMSISGDEPLVVRAMRTLEMMSDTFLPVNEIAQFSVPGVIGRGQEFLATYKNRIESARNDAVAALGSALVTPPQGGFYCVIPFERAIEEEELAIELVTEEKVLVHPGYFYDIEGQHLVFSFVGAEDRVTEGIRRIRLHLS